MQTPPRKSEEARTSSTSVVAAPNAAWSPYTSWCGDAPAEAPECFLYALLWLESVALAPRKGAGGTREARLAQLLHPPTAARKLEALRNHPIPMASLLRAASPSAGQRGANAMEVLGPAVYAWLQPEWRTLWDTSWHGLTLTPRQLCLYLETTIAAGRTVI